MSYTQDVIQKVQKLYPDQVEFHQAVKEVLESIEPALKKDKRYESYKVLERIVIPERQINFRVTWEDDKGEIQVNRGYRIEFSSLLGP